MPERIQLSRRKGWKMPPNTVSVARPSRWGNPFACYRYPVYRGETDAWPIRCETVEEAVERFRAKLARTPPDDLERYFLAPLRGKNLACWCPLDKPCHADVLLEIANR